MCEVKVEQVDREAAEEWRGVFNAPYSEYDGDEVADLALDFARHRASAIEEAAKVADDSGNEHDTDSHAESATMIATAIRALAQQETGNA